MPGATARPADRRPGRKAVWRQAFDAFCGAGAPGKDRFAPGFVTVGNARPGARRRFHASLEAHFNLLVTTGRFGPGNLELAPMTAARQPVKPVRLRGRSFLALVLSPELPFSDWLASLDDLAARSTGFFLGRPIVLDVEALNGEGLGFTAQELSDLVTALAARGVRIMGIEGAAPSQLGPGMPPAMRGGREAGDIQPEATPGPTKAGQAPAAAAATAPALPALVQAAQKSSLVIDAPVRSGQSIIFPEGDVTILGSVGSGAEVIAGGSIHIYGSLRGRALAGSAGQTDARIFCRKLEAELIAIDGLYKTAEDIEPKLHGQSVQIWLDGDRLKTVALA